jgi:acyl-CoA reductase-like NAD-dependent aldehyde dehydrogenase
MNESAQVSKDKLMNLRFPDRMLINGRLVSAVSGKTFSVENPATGQPVANVPAGDKRDIDLAVAAARAAFDGGPWRQLRYTERTEILWRWSDIILANIDEMARLETIDNGMPLGFATDCIRAGVNTLRYYAGMCSKIYGRTSEISGNGQQYHTYSLSEPVGVAGLITPWNGPFPTVCTKVAPALAAGCTVVLKPAEQTPLTALRMANFAMEAGVPAGVFNVVTGLGETAGAALANHPDVDKISFTGSTAVGKLIVQASANNLKRLSLELGGKSAAFIFEDANMQEAIPTAAMGIFRNTGQMCFAGSRLFVQDSVLDKVVAGITEVAQSLRLGNGLDPGTQLGPLISAKQLTAVMNYVEIGRAEGAEVVTGGSAVMGPGYFMKPTVFLKTNAKMRITREEIFGPVLVVQPFSSLDDVASLANDTTYGLGGGVYTRDISKAHLVAKALRTGNVWVNCYGFTDKTMPFGGYKQSGLGREGGPDGIDAFLEKKAVYIRL